ncbi:retrovirus-related pol polyprotein from transposon TNT 1-94 [Tanacetum coccineum]
MAGVDINTLTMEQYLALSRDNHALGVVKPEIGCNVNFEIKSQFMCELREDTFSENKNEDAHNHIDRASINVMPMIIFEHLHLTNLKKTNMLYEMAEMSKKAPLGIVENVLVKIDKFLFPSDFVIIDITYSKSTILGRPFLATIHAEIDVFAEKFSLGINEDRISFDTLRNDHNYTNPSEKHFMVNSGLINRPHSPAQSNNQIDYEELGDWDNRSPNLGDQKHKK